MESIRKRIIKGSGVYGIGKILPKVIRFLLIPIYTRFLTTSDYGIVSVVGVIVGIMEIILPLGLPASVTRYYFDYSKESKEFRDFLGSVLIFFLLFGFSVVAILTFFGKPVFENLFSNIPFSPYIILGLWTALFVSIKTILLNIYRAKENALKYVSFRVASFLLTTGLIIYFVVIAKEGALGKIKGSFYASLIFFIIFLVLTFNRSNVTLSKPKLSGALKFGLPLVPHALSALILSSADRILLSRIKTLSEVGLYSIGYQIGHVFSIIMSSIDYAWIPIYYNIAKNEVEHKAKRIFSRMATIYITFGSVLATGVILFSREIIYFMAAERFHPSHPVVPVVAAGYLIHLTYLMSVRALYLKKKTYMMAPITGFAAIINIGLNILWIPEFGMMGAAYATLVSFLIQCILIHIFAQRIYRIPYEYRNLSMIIAFVGGIFFINYSLDFKDILVSLIVKFLIFLSFIVLLFLSRIISLDEIRKIKEAIRLK
ncbi:oligosaccharide flippase family protein [candidate division WOR-3 bacterium]|nr:oligosaccharide flippase family protein [candidate division WOR-3 bacterium]